jgi:allantoinase
MATASARMVGVDGKGEIAVGGAADLVVFAPEAESTVDAARLEHRHPITPYDGRTLAGAVREAYLAGERIDRLAPRGRLLRRA